MYEVDSFEYDGFTVRIIQYEDAMSPADWDTLGTFVSWHRGFNLGHEQKHSLASERGNAFTARYVTLTARAVASVLVEIIDDSYLLIRETSDAEHADGVLYTTRERCDELGVRVEDAEDALRSEINEWAQYASGDVYGYVIEDEKGNTLDSLWGLYGIEYALEEAKRAVEDEAKHERGERERAANQDIATT